LHIVVSLSFDYLVLPILGMIPANGCKLQFAIYNFFMSSDINLEKVNSDRITHQIDSGHLTGYL